MGSYYIYFVSSLPMLHFGAKLPFSFKKLLKKCQGIISDSDIAILNSILLVNDSVYVGNQPTLKKWYDFDRKLRNELVKVRAGRKHLDSQQYLRGDANIDSYINRIVMSAFRNPLVLEAEKMLDRVRWQVLDELVVRHYFDIDFLIAYSLKLLILQRWESISYADRAAMLEKALQINS